MIVIPMMGLSSRFFNAGYTTHKYMLPLHGKTVFDHVILSFKNYFDDEFFTFICREKDDEKNFIFSSLKKLGVKNFRVITLISPTQGQADTVSIGLKEISPLEELYIFNIDTFRSDFTKPAMENLADGYLEVFIGKGDHWSFVMPGENNQVQLTTEKQRISDYCSDGLYYFKHKGLFDSAYGEAKADKNTVNSEYYIAPLYNYLIQSGHVVKYGIVPFESLTFCGTPEDYEEIVRRAKVEI